MKVLMIFIDMVRLDHLNIYNEKSKDTALDKVLKGLGGTIFSRCYTPSPDTPRSLACMQTGLYPYFNGCDTRIKWPRYFIKENIDTIWDIAAQKGYTVNLCARQHYIETGMFRFKNDPNIHMFNTIDNFVNESSINNDCLSYIGTPDIHLAVDDMGGTERALHEGFNMVAKLFNDYLTNDYINKFDYTFIFSDHGLQLENERRYQLSKLELLGDGRTRLLMFMHKKNEKGIVRDYRLSSMVDLFETINQLIGGDKKSQGYSFLTKPERKILHIEDHTDFIVAPEVMIKQWRVITENYDISTDVYQITGCTNDNLREEVSSYLEYYSPKYKTYVKQLKVWKLYARLKNENLKTYFIGDNRKQKFYKIRGKIIRRSVGWILQMFGRIRIR